MKNSSDTVGFQSRDLPVCSAVPKPLRHPAYTQCTLPFNERYKYLCLFPLVGTEFREMKTSTEMKVIDATTTNAGHKYRLSVKP